MKGGKVGKHVLLCILMVLLAVPPGVLAQGPPPAPPPPGPPQPAPTFRPEELEQLVAPIALYPDPLLAQIFMASTYPLEVVQADRFAKANAQLKGPQLDEALKQQTWDDSVKSLVAFPPVLSMMSEKLDWTQKLGDAILADQRGVLNAVQVLRARAQAAGNLQTTAEQRVIVEPAPPPPPPVVQPGEERTLVIQQPAPPPQIIQIQPADPQAVQLPAYNPAVIYGPWPYPAYPPYPYYPPGYMPGAALLTFGAGMAVGAALWGNCNWGGGDINVNRSNYQNFSNNVNRSDIANNRIQNLPAREGGRGNWQHRPEHRQAVPYRDQGTAQRFGQGTRPGADSREAFRGRADAGRQQLGQGGFGAGGGPRAGQQPALGGGQGFGGQRGQGGFDRGPGGGLGDRGGFGSGQGSRGGRQPGAFQGMGQGGQTRDFSNRGQASRQGMSAPRSAPAASRGGGAPRGGGGAPRGGGGGPRGGGGGGRRR